MRPQATAATADGSKRVLYKLDKYGCGQLILQQNLGAIENPSLLHFSRDMFLHMCVLGECELSSLPFRTALILVIWRFCLSWL